MCTIIIPMVGGATLTRAKKGGNGRTQNANFRDLRGGDYEKSVRTNLVRRGGLPENIPVIVRKTLNTHAFLKL